MKASPNRSRQHGFSIVELLVALVLGLFVTAGFVNVFISSREAFRTNEGLARLQENARVGSELLLREIRSAGGRACTTKLVANVLQNPGDRWWSDWAAGPVRGVDGNVAFSGVTTGTGTAQRITGTDLLMLLTTTAVEGVAITGHNTSSAVIDLSTNAHGLNDNDVIMVCDGTSAAMLQITHLPGSGKIGHNAGGSTSPGNCSKGLGYPPVCTTGGTEKAVTGGTIATLEGSVWYVGGNGRGTRSLYRLPYDGTAQEVVEGVEDMQVEYLRADTANNNALDTTWKTATDVGSSGWSESAVNRVVAVKVTLTLRSNEAVAVGGQRLQRTFVHVIHLRNREVL